MSKHEHDLYEQHDGWWCTVCGQHLMQYYAVPTRHLWGELRRFRRAIKDWRNG